MGVIEQELGLSKAQVVGWLEKVGQGKFSVSGTAGVGTSPSTLKPLPPMSFKNRLMTKGINFFMNPAKTIMDSTGGTQYIADEKKQFQTDVESTIDRKVAEREADFKKRNPGAAAIMENDPKSWGKMFRDEFGNYLGDIWGQVKNFAGTTPGMIGMGGLGLMGIYGLMRAFGNNQQQPQMQGYQQQRPQPYYNPHMMGAQYYNQQ